MYKCISFLQKSNDSVVNPIEIQFNEYFRDKSEVVIDNTQVVSNSFKNSNGDTIYQDIMYVWYRE